MISNINAEEIELVRRRSISSQLDHRSDPEKCKNEGKHLSVFGLASEAVSILAVLSNLPNRPRRLSERLDSISGRSGTHHILIWSIDEYLEQQCVGLWASDGGQTSAVDSSSS